MSLSVTVLRIEDFRRMIESVRNLLLFACLCVPVFGQSVESEVRRVTSDQVYAWAKHSTAAGPIDTRERLDVWLRSKDATVRAFRVTVRYQVRGAVTAETRIVANDIENGGLCQIRLSDPSAVVVSITVGRLVEQESSDVPVS
jgi:hypothetical protein